MKNFLVPVVFGLACLSGCGVTAARADLVGNPSFEEELKGWSIPAPSQTQVSISNEKARTGTRSLRIVGKAGAPYVAQSVGGIQPGSYYRYSVWAAVLPGADVGAVEGAVKIENYNAESKNTSGKYGRIGMPPDGQWRQIVVEFQADPDTTRTSVLLRVYGNAPVFFDDASLEPIGKAPDVSIVNTHPIAIQTGVKQTLEQQLLFGEAWQGAGLPQIKANIRSLDGKYQQEVAATVKQGESNRLFATSIEVPALTGGDYAVDFSYERDGKKLGNAPEKPVYLFTTEQKRKPNYLTDSGVILHNGQPFFPIGMYHAGGTDADYKKLADSGINSVQGNPTLDLDAFKASLDLAQKYNLAVDVPFYAGAQVAKNLENSLEKIRRFKDHPAVFTWKIIDEPDLRPEIMHEVPGVYRALKAADPDHPIELTMALDDGLKFWSNYCDILQIDRYPVPGRPLTEVSAFSRNAKSVMEPWQNLTYVVQSGWVPDLSNQPTAPQARSMVYLALIEGAKGIFWYSMYDPGWDLTKTPFWPHMKGINAEIQQLSTPMMLGEKVEGITATNDKVHFTAREHGGKLYLLVTNPGDAASEVSISFPNALKLKNGQPLNGGAGVSLNGQALQLQLGAIDSRTYVFDVE